MAEEKIYKVTPNIYEALVEGKTVQVGNATYTYDADAIYAINGGATATELYTKSGYIVGNHDDYPEGLVIGTNGRMVIWDENDQPIIEFLGTEYSSSDYREIKLFGLHRLYLNENEYTVDFKLDDSYFFNIKSPEGQYCLSFVSDEGRVYNNWDWTQDANVDFNKPVDFNSSVDFYDWVSFNSQVIFRDEVASAKTIYVEGSKVVTEQSIKSIINEYVSPLIKTTYRELKQMRDNNQLIPGKQYLINDYEYIASPLQNSHISGEHNFGIIVTADSTNELNENARAVKLTTEAEWVEDITVDDIQILYSISNVEDGYTTPAEQWDRKVNVMDMQLSPTGQLVPVIIEIDPEGDSYWINTAVEIKYVMRDGTEELYTEWLSWHKDVIVEMDYRNNVPILYKTNPFSDSGWETDYFDELRYYDDYVIDGQTYNRWKKHDGNEETEDHFTGYYILTNVVVVDNQFTITQEQIDNSFEFKYQPSSADDVFYYSGKYEFEDNIYDLWWAQPNEEGVIWGRLTNKVVNSTMTDDYFKNCNLAAWELKYCLDNDVDRFDWACPQMITNMRSYFSNGRPLIRYPEFDNRGYSGYPYAWGTDEDVMDTDPMSFVYTTTETLGPTTLAESEFVSGPVTPEYIESKGVIYYMKDEHGNEMGYDFKNIKFSGSMNTNLDSEQYYYSFFVELAPWIYTQWGQLYQIKRAASYDTYINNVRYYGYICNPIPNAWSTPYCLSVDESLTENSSLCQLDGSEISYGGSIAINENQGIYDSTLLADYVVLNNTVAIAPVYDHKGIHYSLRPNFFDGNSYNNQLLALCDNNLLIGSDNNQFNTYCANNYLYSSRYNQLDAESSYNNFMQSSYNILGPRCTSNEFISANNNILVAYCSSNTFSSYVIYATLNSNCSGNYFDTNMAEFVLEPTISYLHLRLGENVGYASQFTISRGLQGDSEYNRKNIYLVESNGNPIVYKAANTTEIILD